MEEDDGFGCWIGGVAEAIDAAIQAQAADDGGTRRSINGLALGAGGRSQHAGYSGWNTMALMGGRQNSAECCWLWQGTFSAVTPPRLPWLLPA